MTRRRPHSQPTHMTSAAQWSGDLRTVQTRSSPSLGQAPSAGCDRRRGGDRRTRRRRHLCRNRRVAHAIGRHARRIPRTATGTGRPAAADAERPADVLHSEFVVANGHGGFTTKMTQTGTVDEITLSSIVVRSDDGYTQIYVFPSAAVVPDARRAERHGHRGGHANRPDGDPQQHRRGATARELTGAHGITGRIRPASRPSPSVTRRRLRRAGRLLDCARLTQRHLGTGNDGRRTAVVAERGRQCAHRDHRARPDCGRRQFDRLRIHALTSDHSIFGAGH